MECSLHASSLICRRVSAFACVRLRLRVSAFACVCICVRVSAHRKKFEHVKMQKYLYTQTRLLFKVNVHVELVNFFESVATTRTTTTLAYNTQQIMKFLVTHPIWCRTWHSENLLHRSTLRFTAAIASSFCVIVATHVLNLNHELWTMWVGFHVCSHAIEWCLPRVYRWRHAHDKVYQALPLFSRENLVMRLEKIIPPKRADICGTAWFIAWMSSARVNCLIHTYIHT